MAARPKTEVIRQHQPNWWLVAGGVVLVLFAMGTFAFPTLFLKAVTIWAGVGFLFASVMTIGAYVQSSRLTGAGWALIMAVLDIVVGVMMLVHPVALSSTIPWILGVVFALFGVVEIAGVVSLGRLLPESRPIMVVSGLLTVVVGIMFVVWPTSLSLWIAAFAVVRGITLVVMGLISHSPL